MELPRIVPAELRQLARFIPTKGWNAIDWKPMLAHARTLSWRFLRGKGKAELIPVIDDLTPGVDVVGKASGQPLTEVDDPASRRALGDQVLELYFVQWLSDEGLFLDLRSGRFAAEGDRLQFAPNGLWTQLRPEFREGMLGVYRGFYSGDDRLFEASLHSMGLLGPDLSDADREQLIDLLRQHFGTDQSEQEFRIDDFKASFDELFEFFIARDYCLHPDFVVVGFYLITLYLCLEELGQAHDVRAICTRVLLD